ncbi:MAG: alanine--tRNA ligase, partial [Chloroflexota bacterium]
VWLDLGVPPERIYRFGDEDNWWGPAGDEGPCGPCSELHYYNGPMEAVPAPGSPSPEGWGPNVHEDFVEIYNLVFTQFYHHLDGSRTTLKNKNIDTGMGLERAAAVLQQVPDVYETDLFRPLIDRAAELARVGYGEDTTTDRAVRVVAEHARSASFLIGDGVVPGNTGRGYVLRRLIRRAMRFGLSLGLESPFLGEIAEVAVRQMGDAYPELRDNRPFIRRVLELEEERFAQTLETGSRMLESLIESRPAIMELVSGLRSKEPSPFHGESLATAVDSARAELAPYKSREGGDIAELLENLLEAEAARPGATVESVEHAWNEFLDADWNRVITGYEASYLYDTYGFPLEVTSEIAREHGFEVDEASFEQQMELQRERGRASGAAFGGDAASRRVYESLGVDDTPFLGYETLETDTVALALIKNREQVDAVSQGEELEVVLRETPFYAEKGGQVGDTGWITGPEGQLEVLDTQNPYGSVYVHRARVIEGKVEAGQAVHAQVDGERRERIRRNHTATHLLHSALREVLGTHVRQTGSVVAPDRLRFDFTHVSSLTPEEIRQVQDVVNDKIRRNIPVEVHHTTYRQAIEEGALAFFGDTYSNRVRTIKIDFPWSYELCGGTHMDWTGGIGAFVIVSEYSIGSGMRRIEALTGKGAEEFIWNRFRMLDELAEKARVPVGDLGSRVESQMKELEEARRTITRLEREALMGNGQSRSIHELVQDVDGVKVLVDVKNGANQKALREVGDRLRDQLGSGIVVLGSVVEDRPTIIVMVTKDLVAQGYNAGDIVNEIASRMDGRGGGRPDMAQAGGRDASKMDDAVAAVPEIIRAVGAKAT